MALIAGASSAPAGASSDGTSTVLTGTAYTAEGKVQHGGDVTVSVLAPATDLGQITLGTAEVSSEGTFRVPVRRSVVLGKKVDRAVAGSRFTLDVTVRSRSGLATSVVLPVRFSSTSPTGLRHDGGKASVKVAVQQGTGVVTSVRRGQDAEGVVSSAASSRKATIKKCPKGNPGGIAYVTNHLAWKPVTGATKKVWVPLQGFHTGKKSRATYQWRTASETKLGIAAYGSRGWVSAGTSYSQSKSVSNAIDVDYGPNRSVRLDAQWEYQQFREGCFRLGTLKFWTGAKQWRPMKFTGGNRNVKAKPAFTCASRWTVPISNKLTVSKEDTKTWGSSFSIGAETAGVKLDLSQGTSKSITKTWAPAKGVKKVSICGRGDYPTAAADVRAK